MGWNETPAQVQGPTSTAAPAQRQVSVAAVPTPSTTPMSAPSAAPTLAPFPTATPDPDARFFPQTGHTVRGAFRRFWEKQGSLSVFGFPITEPVLIDGVTTQYFERARFETTDGVTVALGRLGYEERLRQTAPVAPAHPRQACRFFSETGHNLCPPV